MTTDKSNKPAGSSASDEALLGTQANLSRASQLLAKYIDFMMHLFSQHALVTVLVTVISYIFISRSDYSFTGKLTMMLFSLFTGPVGIILGEKFREYATPDTFLASGMMDIFWKKLLYRYAPQVVGGLIGVFMAGVPIYFMGHTLGASFLFANRIERYSQPVMDPAIAKLMADSEKGQEKERLRLLAVTQKITNAAPSGVSGSLEFSDVPFSETTIAGLVSYSNSENNVNRGIQINGNRLFNGMDAEWQRPLKLFKLESGQEVILAESAGGRGTSCEKLYFFIVINSSSTVSWTPEFGTCAAGGSYVQSGSSITMTMPKMGGNSIAIFDGNSLVEDGKPVNYTGEHENDPSK